MNDRNLVLTNAFASTVSANSNLDAAETYALSNLFLYYRIMHIKQNLVA